MPKDEHGEYDAREILDSAWPARNLAEHRRLASGAPPQARMLQPADFARGATRTEAEYHAACLAYLSVRPWATESTFLDAIEAAANGTGAE